MSLRLILCFVLTPLSVVCFSGATPAVAANSCTFLPVDPQTRPDDGQMFVRTRNGWSNFESLSALGLRGRTSIDFVYVVRPLSGADRTGVLIIKTNRPATEADGENAKNRVRLVRKETAADVGCTRMADFPGGESWVSTRAYEDYHDYPAPDTQALRRDEAAIKAFHFEYRSARKQRCARTDDASYDDFPLNLNSNRAQFSYDRVVVERGSYTPLRLLWFAPPSGFRGAADHRTQMKKYATSDGIACVQFSLTLDSSDYTVRINDLEGRQLPPSNSRTPEKRWPGP